MYDLENLENLLSDLSMRKPFAPIISKILISRFFQWELGL